MALSYPFSPAAWRSLVTTGMSFGSAAMASANSSRVMSDVLSAALSATERARVSSAYA